MSLFPFDKAALPQITRGKAFIGVDFQNDFTAADGALPVTEPPGYVKRAVDLASAFRGNGDVIWVKSAFEDVRPVDPEQIIVTDAPPAPPTSPRPSGSGSRRTASHRRRLSASVRDAIEAVGPPDPEAFLSHDEPSCLKPSTSGCELAPEIKDSLQKTDLVITKSHYSAFQDTQLLRFLRAKMIMDVFICGSLANVGVYATAMQAATHGMSITIVEDCCGYRSEPRQRQIVKSLIDFTGSEVASSSEVLETVQSPPVKTTPSVPDKEPVASGSRQESVPAATAQGRASNSPDIVRPMTGLRLVSGSPNPTVPGTAPATRAPGGTEGPSKLQEAVPADEPIEDAPPPALEPLEAFSPNEPIEAASPPANAPIEAVSPPANAPIEVASPPADEPIEVASPPVDMAEEQESNVEHKSSDPSQADFQKKDRLSREPVQESPSGPEQTGTADDVATSQVRLCEGDLDIIENLLPKELEKGIFAKLRDEIDWKHMSHQGGEVPRLVAVQGDVAEDGSVPIYRHPSDESPPLSPFSPTVLAIKTATENRLGHRINHALIQYYRDGNDYISEHSDKTLDIVKQSYIANVSLGAERTMVLRTKRLDKDPSQTEVPSPEKSKRKIQRARLPHNSLCRMGLQTNMKWLHAIRQDKRADRDKSTTELAFQGARISLTFRSIGTFLNREETLIWGQGATGKTREDAHAVINGTGPEAIELLKAFGKENHSSTFDWDSHYARGFDVLHMSTSPRFFASSDSIVNMRIALMLAEFGINFAKGSMGPDAVKANEDVDNGIFSTKFVDNDESRSVVTGDLAIMLYLDTVHRKHEEFDAVQEQAFLAKQFSRFQEGTNLLQNIRRLQKASANGQRDLRAIQKELEAWDNYAAEEEGGFLAGPRPSLPDYMVWPVLYALVKEHGLEVFGGLGALRRYFEAYEIRESAQKVLTKAL